VRIADGGGGEAPGLPGNLELVVEDLAGRAQHRNAIGSEAHLAHLDVDQASARVNARPDPAPEREHREGGAPYQARSKR